MIGKQELDFLKQSNNIEEEWSDTALYDSILAWKYINRFKVLTLEVILQTHKILMRTRNCEDSWKGNLRWGNVSVGGKEKMHWNLVPLAIEDWIEETNASFTGKIRTTSGRKRIGSRIAYHKRARASHIAFEEIHPFNDGNGRIGRIIMNWHRKRMGLPLEVITYARRGMYYQWFRRSSSTQEEVEV